MSTKKSADSAAQDTVSHIVDIILDKHGEDIVILDLREITSIADFFIIATGNSTTNIKAIADEILNRMKREYRVIPWHTEGYGHLTWILLDYVDVVVHIFDRETREFYSLETLWKDAASRLVAES